MEKELNLNEKRKKTREDINYLFSKVNWGEGFLDAKAIRIMNEFWKDIIEADKEFIENIICSWSGLKPRTPDMQKVIDVYTKNIKKHAGKDLI